MSGYLRAAIGSQRAARTIVTFRGQRPIPTPQRTTLRTDTNNWKVFALFNHDLGQVFVSASDAPKANIVRECGTIAGELVDWEATRHRIDWIDTVGEFPTLRHAQLYAAWLKREGAFEGAEEYAIGLDAMLMQGAAQA